MEEGASGSDSGDGRELRPRTGFWVSLLFEGLWEDP